MKQVKKFAVKDTKFNGQNISSTALEIIETVTQISDSTFKFNRRGKFKNFTDHDKGETHFVNVHHFVGGVITATGSEINISRSRFENNGAQYGGVIFAHQHSIIILHNSSFTNNSAKNGGVLFCLRCLIIIVTSEFDGNNITPETSSLTEGGGVLFSKRSNITIKASKFNGNTVTSMSNSTKHRVGGGVLHSYESAITIETSKFDGNTATSRRNGGGGVLFSIECNIIIKASYFESNTATARGGVLYSHSSTIIIINLGSEDNQYGNSAQNAESLHINNNYLAIVGAVFCLNQNDSL